LKLLLLLVSAEVCARTNIVYAIPVNVSTDPIGRIIEASHSNIRNVSQTNSDHETPTSVNSEAAAETSNLNVSSVISTVTTASRGRYVVATADTQQEDLPPTYSQIMEAGPSQRPKAVATTEETPAVSKVIFF